MRKLFFKLLEWMEEFFRPVFPPESEPDIIREFELDFGVPPLTRFWF